MAVAFSHAGRRDPRLFVMKEGGLNVVAKDVPGRAMPVDGDSDFVLRAKYLDYCSAQLADVLLLLSPDEMYVLAEDAARDAGLSGELGYDQIVRLATERISRKLALPPFDVWLRDYQANPERYEQYLMGLWEAELQGLFDG
jgi:hypothetical protein